jgi:hypothetical protein
MPIDYYDKQGNPIQLREFAEKFEDWGYRCLKQSKVHDGTELITISTVWLGLDHGWDGGGPLIFETLVRSDSDTEQAMYRYSSEEQAMEHHDHIVDMTKHDRKQTNRFIKILKEQE